MYRLSTIRPYFRTLSCAFKCNVAKKTTRNNQISQQRRIRKNENKGTFVALHFVATLNRTKTLELNIGVRSVQAICKLFQKQPEDTITSV